MNTESGNGLVVKDGGASRARQIQGATGSIKVTKFFLGKRYRSYSFFSSQKSLYIPGTKLAVSGKVKLSEYGKNHIVLKFECIKRGCKRKEKRRIYKKFWEYLCMEK